MIRIQTLPLTLSNRKMIRATLVGPESKQFSVVTSHLESYPLDTSTRFEQMKLLQFGQPDILLVKAKNCLTFNN